MNFIGNVSLSVIFTCIWFCIGAENETHQKPAQSPSVLQTFNVRTSIFSGTLLKMKLFENETQMPKQK
jgi:hypothetical protein